MIADRTEMSGSRRRICATRLAPTWSFLAASLVLRVPSCDALPACALRCASPRCVASTKSVSNLAMSTACTAPLRKNKDVEVSGQTA